MLKYQNLIAYVLITGNLTGSLNYDLSTRAHFIVTMCDANIAVIIWWNMRHIEKSLASVKCASDVTYG